MARKGQRRETGLVDPNAELLVEFANEGRLRPLAGSDLAAGKFP